MGNPGQVLLFSSETFKWNLDNKSINQALHFHPDNQYGRHKRGFD